MGNSTKRKLLDDSDSESDGGAPVDASFKVNEEYARRFEHNKKREEQHRCEQTDHPLNLTNQTDMW